MKIYLKVIVAIGLINWVAASNAASVTNTFLVKATVIAACNNVTATTLAFGNYSLAELRNQNNITVNCTAGTSYTVALNGGQAGQFNPRAMLNGTNRLNYNIYTAADRTTVWGDGSGGSQTVAGTGTSTLTAYGDVPANQTTAEQGDYNDTITVTVNY